MAEIVTCFACNRAYVKKLGMCPNCSSEYIHVVEKPKSKLYWAGAAIYYPLYGLMFVLLCAGLYAVMSPIL